jgi:hypothetical protein
MHHVHHRIRIAQINYFDDSIADSSSDDDPFLVPDLARVATSGAPNDRFDFRDGTTMLRGVREVPTIPPECPRNHDYLIQESSFLTSIIGQHCFKDPKLPNRVF